MGYQWTDKEIAEALKATVGNIHAAAKRLGCARSTIDQRLAKRPDLRAIIDSARKSLVDDAERGLRELVRENDAGSVRFVLSRLKRDVYGDRVELTGVEGGPIEKVVKHEFNPDDLDELSDAVELLTRCGVFHDVLAEEGPSEEAEPQAH